MVYLEHSLVVYLVEPLLVDMRRAISGEIKLTGEIQDAFLSYAT